MRLPRDKDVLENARALRKSMTREERHLWYDFLRGYSPRFVRQKVVGRYILDFYCDAAGLARGGREPTHERRAARPLTRRCGATLPQGRAKVIERGLVNLCQP